MYKWQVIEIAQINDIRINTYIHIYIYIYIYTHIYIYTQIYIYIWSQPVLALSLRKITSWGSKNPQTLLVFASACPPKVQISQGLGPFLQIELLKTGRALVRTRVDMHVVYIYSSIYSNTYIYIYIYMYILLCSNLYIVIYIQSCSYSYSYSMCSTTRPLMLPASPCRCLTWALYGFCSSGSLFRR